MNADFVNLVKQMRQAQKSYFATRNKSALYQSKDIEKQVDAQIEAFEKAPVPSDLTQLNRDVVDALKANGLQEPAVVVAFTCNNDGRERAYWVSNVKRSDGITLLEATAEKMKAHAN